MVLSRTDHFFSPREGSSGKVRLAAKRRLDAAADVLVQRLLRSALDGDVSDNIALQAVLAALDRAGLSVKHAVEIAPATPFEIVFDEISSGPRSESRKARGVPDDSGPPLQLPAGEQLAFDVAAVDTDARGARSSTPIR